MAAMQSDASPQGSRAPKKKERNLHRPRPQKQELRCGTCRAQQGLVCCEQQEGPASHLPLPPLGIQKRMWLESIARNHGTRDTYSIHQCRPSTPCATRRLLALRVVILCTPEALYPTVVHWSHNCSHPIHLDSPLAMLAIPLSHTEHPPSPEGLFASLPQHPAHATS